MEATSFNESNDVLDKPDTLDKEDCEALSVWRGRLMNGCKGVISCWKPTKEELDVIQRTGRVWVIVLGKTMAPTYVSGYNPFSPENLENPPIFTMPNR